MANRDEALKDYEAGLSYKEIAEKYGVSENTVKSWASRYWNNIKGATKARKKSQRKKKAEKVAESEPKKKRGAPVGNRNAAGKESGAPLGNDNARKHGGYSQIYWDTLSDEERELIKYMPTSEEDLLLDQIKLLSVRERRLMVAIAKTREKAGKGGMVVDAVHLTENKRNFHGNKLDEELYKELIAQKVENGDRLPGDPQAITSISENVENVILRMEKELTSVQRQKSQAIKQLYELHLNDGNNNSSTADDWIAAVMEAENG